ncbi:aspartyl/asparaginyl beta-hydroxylase domain-containing protein [Pantoea sp. Cy-639]|uniref:aspartyl/asparaginyl beta-hydroxylase domain-containing protein n=1 Tax=Pantoea sp. Cy-639 TaxID=2608360 RepID=UPI00141F7C59|nr:aspartyl/asparaginyl beta-hydroxylase domain-containing protein [Pantoea sp. Cy-639]NIF18115.1 beta-hydroxylase [Pantoea sp. Cy-639]
MSKRLRKQLGACAAVIAVALFAYASPPLFIALVILLVACGLYDFSRNGTLEPAIVKKYFLGGGRNTWALAPFNTLIDLFSRRNRHIYALDELPPACQQEIEQVIQRSMRHKAEIVEYLDSRMQNDKRGMLFFQWYGRKNDCGLSIPELQQPLEYVKTIGVSVFNDNQSTSFHFGPLRMMLRVLYNISPPRHSPGVYIQVKRHKHYWHDDPLFIFDDTLLHASFNKGGGKRYCLFIDIIRPSPAHRLLNMLVLGFSRLVFGLRKTFYKNWKAID